MTQSQCAEGYHAKSICAQYLTTRTDSVSIGCPVLELECECWKSLDCGSRLSTMGKVDPQNHVNHKAGCLVCGG